MMKMRSPLLSTVMHCKTVRPTSFRRFATANTPKNKKSRSTVGLLIFSGICVGTGALGVWQIKRYYWKLGVIEDSKTQHRVAPQDMPRFAQQEQLVEFAEFNNGKQVNVIGIFDHDKEMLMGLRTAPVGISAPAQGLASNPQGYYVITPMKLQGGALVFVNRGWVPRAQQNWSRPAGEVKLAAVISHEEKGGYFAPPNKPSSGRLFWLEGRALTEAYNSKGSGSAAGAVSNTAAAVILEAVTMPEIATDGANPNASATQRTVYPYARRADELHQEHITPFTHLVYAVTWFSLSAFGSVMTYIKFLR